MIAGIFMMIIKRIPNGIFIFVFFLFLTYLFSSWGVWYFGGAYGSRPFVDFYPLLCIPFGYFINSVYSLKKIIVKIVFTAFLVFFSFYNLKLIYNYQCFTGSTWGWDDFIRTLDRAGMYNLERNTYTLLNDFENITLNDGIPKTWDAPHSYSRSTYMVEDIFYNCNYYRKTDNIIRHKTIKTASLSFWIRPKDCDKTGAFAVFKIIGAEDKTLCTKLIRVDDFPTYNNHYTKITGIFEVPDSISRGNVFCFYLWNKNQKKFFIDDLKIVFDSRAKKPD